MTKPAKKGSGFLLDANVFINAHRDYYRFGVCPGYWQALVWHEVTTIDRVRKELEAGKDKLWDWFSKQFPNTCVVSTDDTEIIRCNGEAVTWVHGRDYTDAAKSEFGSKADSWLIATAKARNLVLVTLEQPRPKKRSKVFIPDVCNALNIKHVNTYDMLEAMQTAFHWEMPR